MSRHQHFNLNTLDDLCTLLGEFGLELPINENLTALGDKIRFGKWEIPNRFVINPMEGFDADREGTPGELAFRRYRRYARGGSGLIWFEATAVVPEGRSNAHQFWLTEDNLDTYKHLVEQTRTEARNAFGHDIVCILQTTHSGRYSKPDGVPQPILAHRNEILDPLHNLPDDYPVISCEELDRLQEDYVSTAKLAREAGFDGIDIKACHRYLVSGLLASHTREGRYGGSYENRTRFLREVMEKINAINVDLFVTTRMNAFDAIPYPWGWGMNKDKPDQMDLSEPLQLGRDLAAIGAPLLNVSIGNPYFNPHIGRPYDRPTVGSKKPDEHPIEGVCRFIDVSRQFQKALPNVPIVGGGYGWLRHLLPEVAAGLVENGDIALIGQGRGAFAYPDSVQDILEKDGMVPDKCCVNCSACTQIMRDGGRTGCLVRDAEVYGPEYREARMAAMEKD